MFLCISEEETGEYVPQLFLQSNIYSMFLNGE